MNVSGIVAGVLSAGALLAGHYGQPALAAALADPTLASELTTAAIALAAAGSIIAGVLPGVRKDAK